MPNLAIQVQQARLAESYFLYDAASVPAPDDRFFDVARWRGEGAVLSSAEGRVFVYRRSGDTTSATGGSVC